MTSLCDRNCTWRIKAPQGNSVNLTFSHFEMEDHYGRYKPSHGQWLINASINFSGNCSYDYLDIKQVGAGGSVTQLGNYCGQVKGWL